MPEEGALGPLHYDKVVDDVSVNVSISADRVLPCNATHENMTRFGSRFLEKGRRSGSCFDVHSSMMRYCIRPRPINLRWFGGAIGMLLG